MQRLSVYHTFPRFLCSLVMNSSVALKADRSSITPCPQGMGSEPCDRLTGLFFHVISFPSGTPFPFTCTSTYEHTQIQTPETYPFSFPGPPRWQYLPFSNSRSMGTAACHQFCSDLQGFPYSQTCCCHYLLGSWHVSRTWSAFCYIPWLLYHEACAVVSQ